MMMKQLRFLLSVLLLAVVGVSWADEVTTTYDFYNKSWGAYINVGNQEREDWTSNKDGYGYANSGVQVTANYSGANATSPKSFSNVTKVVVTYNTNKSAGAGTIKVKIGENTAHSAAAKYSSSIAADGRSANYTVEFDDIANESGYITLTANVTTNTLYIVRIAITHSDDDTPTPSDPVDPEVSFADASKTIEVGGTYTNGLTKPGDLTVTYGSSDEGVATVDALTGAVTGVAAGEATITASWAAVEGKYNEGSASYVLTVEAAQDLSGDLLKADDFAATGNSYTDSEGIVKPSGAVYAGKTATNNGAIQLRSSGNDVGIVSTKSGGTVKRVAVKWNSATAAGRTLNVYGKSSAYASASDLYDTAKQGTLIGTLVYGGESNALEIEGNYEYVGLRSESSALYLDQIGIEWDAAVSISLGHDATSYFSADKALDFSDTELTPYVVTEKKTGYTIIEPIEGKQVPAGTPIVIKGAAGEYTVPVVAESAQIEDTNLLVGVSGEAYTVTDADYGYVYRFVYSAAADKTGFQKAKAGQTVSVGKAYLRLPVASSKEFIGFDELAETTGMGSVERMAIISGAIYNLSGQRVGEGYRGVVIQNGRKRASR